MEKVKNALEKLKKEIRIKFGEIGFEPLEKWSDIQLFGLSENDTEKALGEVRELFNSLSIDEQIEALETMLN